MHLYIFQVSFWRLPYLGEPVSIVSYFLRGKTCTRTAMTWIFIDVHCFTDRLTPSSFLVSFTTMPEHPSDSSFDGQSRCLRPDVAEANKALRSSRCLSALPAVKIKFSLTSVDATQIPNVLPALSRRDQTVSDVIMAPRV